MIILGIETSCDETGAAVYNTAASKLLSHALYSQIDLHKIYGGVVPEIASRSQLEKIDLIVDQALGKAGITLDDVDAIAVTTHPGLAGSLLVGASFAKALAWSKQKKLISVNHLEGHIFSAFLNQDGSKREDLTFPFICFSASGGHTSLYYVTGFGEYKLIGGTIDDAAGEAFDKVSKSLLLGYPGGALLERCAEALQFKDICKYPRTLLTKEGIDFSFSGLKTAVLYDLVKKGAYELSSGPIVAGINQTLINEVASSLHVCIGDIFAKAAKTAFMRYPEATAFTFVGGVACNKYLAERIRQICDENKKLFVVTPRAFCTDNGAMIAFVGSYKAQRGEFSQLDCEVGLLAQKKSAQ